ncbi:hypothetical protein BpHYR1_019137 [Brachionus plicatilis]|uniref:Uncharacterized protein n=1 Tax=Brachionus plicatilis TaxID=10195 RepID=A0A3M7PUU2_BRAPC|nr:hypothetical protein BpHYR1_019137 [Brachionus plicatilis]
MELKPAKPPPLTITFHGNTFPIAVRRPVRNQKKLFTPLVRFITCYSLELQAYASRAEIIREALCYLITLSIIRFKKFIYSWVV